MTSQGDNEKITQANPGNLEQSLKTRALHEILLLGDKQTKEGSVCLASEAFAEIRKQRASG